MALSSSLSYNNAFQMGIQIKFGDLETERNPTFGSEIPEKENYRNVCISDDLFGGFKGVLDLRKAFTLETMADTVKHSLVSHLRFSGLDGLASQAIAKYFHIHSTSLFEIYETPNITIYVCGHCDDSAVTVHHHNYLTGGLAGSLVIGSVPPYSSPEPRLQASDEEDGGEI
jgi:hypothetical protein